MVANTHTHTTQHTHKSKRTNTRTNTLTNTHACCRQFAPSLGAHFCPFSTNQLSMNPFKDCIFDIYKERVCIPFYISRATLTDNVILPFMAGYTTLCYLVLHDQQLIDDDGCHWTFFVDFSFWCFGPVLQFYICKLSQTYIDLLTKA